MRKGQAWVVLASFAVVFTKTPLVGGQTPPVVIHQVWASPTFERPAAPCLDCKEIRLPTKSRLAPRERDCPALSDGSGAKGRWLQL